MLNSKENCLISLFSLKMPEQCQGSSLESKSMSWIFSMSLGIFTYARWNKCLSLWLHVVLGRKIISSCNFQGSNNNLIVPLLILKWNMKNRLGDFQKDTQALLVRAVGSKRIWQQQYIKKLFTSWRTRFN